MRTSLCSRGVRYAGAALCLSLVMTGCSSLSGASQLHKSAKGSVQLQEVNDWAFEATHPAVIDRMTMMKIISGVLVDNTASGTKMPATGGKPMRAFSDEDAEFIAPLLAIALSKAKPEQIVGFTVSSSAGSGAEPTAGTLYVQGTSIYVTLVPSRGRKASAFMPSGIARLEKAPSFAGAPGGMSVVIDYHSLAKSASSSVTVAESSKPVAATVTAGSVTAAKPITVTDPAPGSDPVALTNDELLSRKMDELRQARETNRSKEVEITMLKKEAAWLKRELRERSEEIKALRSSKVSAHQAPKKKTAEAYSVR